jgi:hypothetical protein
LRVNRLGPDDLRGKPEEEFKKIVAEYKALSVLLNVK